MERPCYRCGAQVEEHTTFCPACGAPQIKVALPATSTQVPVALPMSAESPDSIQAPALPLQPPPEARIQWKKFWRIGSLLALISGVALFFLGPLGILVFLLGVAIAVIRYRREHPGPLLVSHGALLGALMGLLNFVVAFIFTAIAVMNDPSDARRQMLAAIQQKTAGSPDPRVQQVTQFLSTEQGFIAFLIFAAVFMLVFCLALASATGALTAVFSRDRKQR